MKFRKLNGVPKSIWLSGIAFYISCALCLAQNQSSVSTWYEFSPDNKECIIKNSNLPTPWLNRLGNDVFFTWITHNGHIESYLLDPTSNGLTNPQKTSGRFYIRDRSNGTSFQINRPAVSSAVAASAKAGAASAKAEKGQWESRVGLGYNQISNQVNGLAAQVTYFIPREENVLIMLVDVTNNTGQSKELDLFSEVEWNLGDPTKSIIYKGDGRGGSQFNLYKKAFRKYNGILARQETWKSTATCSPWPYTGFFSVSEPLASYETIKDNFLGTGGNYDFPDAVEKGTCSNTDFWSQAEYPVGVLQNTFSLKDGEKKTLVYALGMAREEKDIQMIEEKYKDAATARRALQSLHTFYDNLINSGVTIETPDKENDRMINIWTKYLWRQFWKKSLNNGAYGLGAWSYGLEGEDLGAAPEQFLLPLDMNILKNCITDVLQNQLSDTAQTDLFNQVAHSMLYKDLGLSGPGKIWKGRFKVPHHHSIYGLFSLYYYLIETGDLALLNMKVPYFEGTDGTVWQHIQTGLYIATKGISARGLPRIPAGVGDWMDEFTKISAHGNAESEMLAAEICFLLKGFASIADQTSHQEDGIKWMKTYEQMKTAVNTIAWDGEWYITAFSDRGNPFFPVGSNQTKEGKIYLNAQSWPILSGIAPPERATQSLLSVKKYLMSDYGPLVFSPSYSQYVDYVGTQSIYAPGFRNACIYLRPAGWAIAAACLNNQPDLANEMYDNASLKSREKDMVHFQCEPYVYPENYDGPDHRLRGQGEFQWNLGEGSAWMWTSYVNYILGVRPELDGLLIDPKIPARWPGYKIRRTFRGSVYDIEVRNPQHVSSGVRSISVDGKKIKGKVIPTLTQGRNYKVMVIM